MSHAEVFDHIYRNNLWSVGSGVGSLEENTEHYRWYLRHFMRTNGVRSVVDVGCGDWQIGRLVDWTGISYTGVDVSDVVLAGTRRFERPGVRFLRGDVTREELPAADLLIVKDVLQHWSIADIQGFIPKLRSYRWALITNSQTPKRASQTNADIRPGNFRPIDLSREPFNVPGTFVFWYKCVKYSDEPLFVFLWTNPVPPVRGD